MNYRNKIGQFVILPPHLPERQHSLVYDIDDTIRRDYVALKLIFQ